jgi:hypothetical protein
MTEEDDELDIMALVDEVSLGQDANLPAATASDNVAAWVKGASGLPERAAPPQPWTPRQPQKPEPIPVTPAR